LPLYRIVEGVARVAASRVITIPLPPMNTWLGLAAYTLLVEAASLANADYVAVSYDEGTTLLRVEGVLADDYAAAIAAMVREPPGNPCLGEGAGGQPHPCLEARQGAARLVRELPGFILRYDRQYFEEVARALCWQGSPSDMSIADLAGAVADAIRGKCPPASALSPTTPLLLARAEYYRFLRTLGGPTVTGQAYDAAKALRIPAIAQALGLLGHAWTGVYCTRGATLHVAIAPASGRPGRLVSGDTDYFRALGRLSVSASRAWDGAPPTRLSILLAAVAAACLRSQGIDLEGDSLLMASLAYGQTVTLHWIRPLTATVPVSVVLHALSMLAPRSTGRLARRLYWAVDELLRTAARPEASRGKEQRDALRGLPGRLVEYSNALVQYAESSWGTGVRPKGLAYMAARVAEGYSRVLARAKLDRLSEDFRLLGELAGAAATYEPPLLQGG
jgi:hypothetical protein